MAKIYKATIYVVDIDESYDFMSEIIDDMNLSDGYSVKLSNYSEKEFEWSDDVVVNRIDATVEQYEEFFKNPPPKVVPETYLYYVKIDTINDKVVCQAVDDYIEDTSLKANSSDTIFEDYVYASAPWQAISEAERDVGVYIGKRKDNLMKKVNRMVSEANG